MIGTINSFVSSVVNKVRQPIYNIGHSIVPELTPTPKIVRKKAAKKKVVRRKRN